MSRLKPTNTFSTPRFIHLCIRAILLNQRQWLIGLLASSGIVIVIWLVPTLFIVAETGEARFENLLPTALFIFTLWGLLLTSDIFQELHSPSTAYQSLTLPATSTEKFISSWVLTMPIFLVVTISTIFLIGILSSISVMIFDSSFSGFHIYNPFEESTVNFVLNYLFYNSLFLLGAIYFKKNNFLKTITAFITIMISFLFLWAILGWLYMSLFGLDQFSFEYITSDHGDLFGSLYRWVITPTALLLTYLLLKRRQVV
jgi:hypothetical protein